MLGGLVYKAALFPFCDTVNVTVIDSVSVTVI